MPAPVTPTTGAPAASPTATPNAPPVEPAAPAVSPEGAPATPPAQPAAEPAATTPPAAQPTADPGSEPSAAEKRIRQLVAQREDAKAEAAYYKGLAEGRGPVTPPAQPTAPVAPKPEQFEVYDDYLVAKAKHELRLELAEAAKKSQAEEDRTRVQRVQQTFQSRITAASVTDPELPTIMRDPTLPISNGMAAAIQESEAAPKLLRYLHEHRDEAERLAGLSPFAAARELGRIEAKLTETPANPNPPTPRTISQAPTPIKPVQPAGPVVVDLENLPMDEFVKRRNAAEFGPRR